MYKLIVVAPDGEYQTEGEFKTIEQARERSADMGSRWFFYPFHAILKGEQVVESYTPLAPMQGSSVWDFCDFVKDNSEFLLSIA